MAEPHDVQTTANRSNAGDTAQGSPVTLSLPKCEAWVSKFVAIGGIAESQPLTLLEERRGGNRAMVADPLISNPNAVAFLAAERALSLGNIRDLLKYLDNWVDEAKEVFAELKDFVTQFTDIAQNIDHFVREAYRQDGTVGEEGPATLTLVLRYLLTNECTDRLGRKITKPSGELQAEYLNIALDLFKIILQRQFDQAHHLPWIVNPTTDLQKAHQFWEMRATDLSNSIIGAGASAGLAPMIGLPDDAKKGVSMVIGVTSAKWVERGTWTWIEREPEWFINLMKAITGED